jgi:hypothetical protein
VVEVVQIGTVVADSLAAVAVADVNQVLAAVPVILQQ